MDNQQAIRELTEELIDAYARAIRYYEIKGHIWDNAEQTRERNAKLDAQCQEWRARRDALLADGGDIAHDHRASHGHTGLTLPGS